MVQNDFISHFQMVKSVADTAFKIYQGWSEDNTKQNKESDHQDIIYSKGSAARKQENHLLGNSCTALNGLCISMKNIS